MKNKIKAKIVVGLGYGDEGKGLTTNWLCEKNKFPIVVRFSGGHQAGHTVHRDGIKHTFSNFGAGTLQGVPTYFSEHTTIYPIGIMKESKLLKNYGLDPKLVLHPFTKITTPWDVMSNRMCTVTKANGTCGQGVGATMKRNEGPYKLMAVDLLDKLTLLNKLIQIEKYYNLEQTRELEYECSQFFDAIDYVVSEMNDFNIQISGYDYLLSYKTIVFEGSQGVMLDMDHGVFPNVTYSNTTSKNAMEICDKLKIKDRHVYGVTRAYSTRHGKGDGEYTGVPIELINNAEETNVTNSYQGEFLCTKINYSRLDQAIKYEHCYSFNYPISLVVTCCNQLSKMDTFDVNRLHRRDWFEGVYESYDPTGILIKHY